MQQSKAWKSCLAYTEWYVSTTLAFWALNEGKLNLCCQFGFQRCISVFPHDQQSKGESSPVYTDLCCKDWLTTDRQITLLKSWQQATGKTALERKSEQAGVIYTGRIHRLSLLQEEREEEGGKSNVQICIFIQGISIAEQGSRLEIQLSFHLHMPSPHKCSCCHLTG